MYVDPFKETALVQLNTPYNTQFFESSPSNIVNVMLKVAEICLNTDVLDPVPELEEAHNMSFEEYFVYKTGMTVQRFKFLAENPQSGPIKELLDSPFMNLKTYLRSKYETVEYAYGRMQSTLSNLGIFKAFLSGDYSKAEEVFNILINDYGHLNVNKLTKLL